MKVIICGAGQVGFAIARYLANENNDVTVIDQRPDLLRKLGMHAAHPGQDAPLVEACPEDHLHA